MLTALIPTMFHHLRPLLSILAAFCGYLLAALITTVATDSAAVGSAAGFLIITAGIVLWRACSWSWFRLALSQPKARTETPDRNFWLWVIPALSLCWATGQLMGRWVMDTVGSPQYERNLELQSSYPLALLLVTALVLAPVGEEALMRGVAYPMLRKHFAPVITAVITSAVFALIHGNLVQMMVVFPLGILLAFVYEHTQRLWSVMALHAIFNAASLLIPATLLHTWTHPMVMAITLCVTGVVLIRLRPRENHGALIAV